MVSRVLPLECKVPIQFSFEIAVVEPHPDITVRPLKGIIPASGSIDVVIEFRPASLAVASAEIELSVSQFEFKPIRCVIVGSSAAGLARERELQAATKLLQAAIAELPSQANDASGSLPQKLAAVCCVLSALGRVAVCMRAG